MIYVVVVTYNGSQWIRTCLESVRQHAPAARVIVVDNCSNDDTVEIVASEFPEVELMTQQSNLGFGGGNNLGINRAMVHGATYILLLNQDAYLLPSTMSMMSDFMEAHQQFGVCSPLHCNSDGQSLDRRTYRNYLCRYGADFLCDAAVGQAQPFYALHGVNAAIWFMRASVFETVGGFDPIFFMYGEDDDMLTRFQQHRIGFALLTNARAVHLRESPRAASPVLLRMIYLRSRRIEAGLLKKVKRPGQSVAFSLAVLLSRGVVAPLADMIVDRDLTSFLGSVLATLRVGAKLRRVRMHSRLTARAGSHFLGIGPQQQ